MASNTDAFGRLRVSDPTTIFDSKQIFDSEPLFWDDQETSGSGTGSTHSALRASSTLDVSAATAGTRVRQTFRRFNYQPGKSQMILLTGVVNKASDGTTKRVGFFDGANGIFFEMKDDKAGWVIRSSVSGSPVDTRVEQDDWNLQSYPFLDFSKTQIFVIDFEWLGVGSVRVGFVINGEFEYVHMFQHANRETAVYMSTPNLPIRYELSNDGRGAAETLEHICATVISEGGAEETGIDTAVSTEGVHVDANAADAVYAVIGVRLKSGYLGASVWPVAATLMAETVTPFEWELRMNPTVASTFTYADVTNAPIQRAIGVTANTVTGGYRVAGGYGEARAATGLPVGNSFYLGSAIDGTPDELVLCARPLSANADIQGALTVRRST